MQGMEKIGEAILDKVRVEARDIIKEAENKAREAIEKAKREQEAKSEKNKSRLIEEARGEAARILAQASVRARQELSKTKADIIDGIVGRVKSTLLNILSDEGSLRGLIKEVVDGLGADKARIYVSPKDIKGVRELVKVDQGLASRIVEIKEIECSGGVIVESLDGKIRLDNTYSTRLEMLLPQILVEISKELFES